MERWGGSLLFRGAIAARATREMGPEESDFLVFEPLGQKMTHRTISMGDPLPLPPFPL